MSKSRAKGTAWETAIVEYLRGRGWPHAERRALHGRQDRGDIAGIVGVVIEAKNERQITLAQYANETEEETRRDGPESIGAAWIKRPRHTDPGKGYVLLDGATFTQLLKDAGYQ
jgi:hypothetical protein